MTTKLQDHLAYPPRAFRVERAAAYIGVGTSTYLEMVADGTMPKAIRVHGVVMWDRHEIDAAIDNLKESENSFDRSMRLKAARQKNETEKT